MGLKKIAKTNDRVTELKMRRAEAKARSKISTLKEELVNTSQELLEIEFSPYKAGDHVMCEVVSGKSRKVTECIVEFELPFADSTDKYAYVRPLKADGTLSGRHFQISSPVQLSPVE